MRSDNKNKGEKAAVFYCKSNNISFDFIMPQSYDNFINKSPQHTNKKLCDVRAAFEKYNLISSLHSFMSEKNEIFKNLLPPLKLLTDTEKEELILNLKKLDFNINNSKTA